MEQSIPKGFTAVKDACLVHDWGPSRVALPIDGSEGAVQQLRAKLDQTVDVHAALEFWSLLGFILVHGGWLIPRPTDMIDLVRPLVHHDPIGALDKTLSRARPPRASTQDASADWVVPDFADLGNEEQEGVRRMVERLADDNVLCEGLQKHLKGWKDTGGEERGALLEVLVLFGLMVVHDAGGEEGRPGGGEQEWLCTCRMDSRPGREKWEQARWLAFVPNETRNVSVVRYTFDHVPSALFPHILASQMSNGEYKAGYRRRTELESGMLSVEIKATAERHEFFQLALTPGDNGAVQVHAMPRHAANYPQNHDEPPGTRWYNEDNIVVFRGVQVVVVSSSVGLMRSLCAAIENVITRRFPGLSNDVEVNPGTSSPLNTQHSTLNTQHSTLNTQHSTLSTQHEP